MGHLFGFLALIRPFNGLMMMAGVFVGADLAVSGGAGLGAAWSQIVLGGVAVSLIGFAGNAQNDVIDVAIDRVNRPGRPIPSGRVSEGAADVVAKVLYVGGVVGSFLVGVGPGVLSLICVGILWAYNYRLKHIPLVGNLTIALLVGLTLVYGSMIFGWSNDVLVGVLLAGLITLARELIKDLEDMEGDATESVSTFPQTAGVSASVGLAATIMVAIIVLSPIPYWFMEFETAYLFGVAAVAICLLISVWRLWGEHPASLAGSSMNLKIAMVFGLLALAMA